jgi:hypothetical protein
VVLRTIFRMAWVAIAFAIVTLASLAVLFALGGTWAGDELRAAAPKDPVVRDSPQSSACCCSRAPSVRRSPRFRR